MAWPHPPKVVATWEDLRFCERHKTNHRPGCMSCEIAIEWSVYGQFCHCGQKATGYRCMSKDGPIEFFCDSHFLGVPDALAMNDDRQGDK